MVEILLATYNGERHIAAQIDSILSQSFQDWTILIHDDGSIDQTVNILKKYQACYPDKIALLNDGIVAGGAKNNFAHLLRHSSGEYIMFCDQDDIWLPSKIELTFSAMIGTEREMGDSAPIAVFSDVKVVDSNLVLIAESGWHYQRNGPQFCKELGLLAVRNCITGCTMMINRAALAISSPFPSEAIMHDWWIGLCVLKNGGRLIPLDAKTILYRQHGGNVIGAAKYNLNYYVKKTLGFTQTIRELFDVYLMAKRVGAIKSWIDFIRFKISAFSQVIAKK